MDAVNESSTVADDGLSVASVPSTAATLSVPEETNNQETLVSFVVDPGDPKTWRLPLPVEVSGRMTSSEEALVEEVAFLRAKVEGKENFLELLNSAKQLNEKTLEALKNRDRAFDRLTKEKEDDVVRLTKKNKDDVDRLTKEKNDTADRLTKEKDESIQRKDEEIQRLSDKLASLEKDLSLKRTLLAKMNQHAREQENVELRACGDNLFAQLAQEGKRLQQKTDDSSTSDAEIIVALLKQKVEDMELSIKSSSSTWDASLNALESGSHGTEAVQRTLDDAHLVIQRFFLASFQNKVQLDDYMKLSEALRTLLALPSRRPHTVPTP